MVPVRKPGRPLSACPHPKEHACGCGSVTAAIPRKQTCHCGTDTPKAAAIAQIASQPPNPTPLDAPSPTKPAFKVQKSSRPPSSRKQSFDPANFERMDMNQINVVPYDQRAQDIPISMTNGYTMSGQAPVYVYTPQYANIQPQFGHIPMQPPPLPYGMNGHALVQGGTNGYHNGVLPHNGLEHVIEGPLATTFENGDLRKFVNGGSYSPPMTPTNNKNNEVGAPNVGSCCAPKPKSHSHSSSNNSTSEPQEPEPGSCCAPKPDQRTLKQEPMSNGGSAHSTPQIPHEMLPQNGVQFHPAMYSQFGPEPTVFTYPATWGSFQNPLQPSAWRESIRASNYSQPQVQIPPGPLSFDAPLIPDSLATIHTCGCGDSCQCIGCAAHPYNDATQEYVRSASEFMSTERPGSEVYSNGNASMPPQSTEPISSPTPNTPSSTTSGHGDELNLSASDFFFVNYPSGGCGGDTQSCPCGDDCQCLGCTIHNQPAIPCEGEDPTCPCESDCQCIGCEIHKGERAS